MDIRLIRCVSSSLRETCGRLLKKDIMILHQQEMIQPLPAEVQRSHFRFLLKTKKRSKTTPLPWVTSIKESVGSSIHAFLALIKPKMHGKLCRENFKGTIKLSLLEFSHFRKTLITWQWKNQKASRFFLQGYWNCKCKSI